MKRISSLLLLTITIGGSLFAKQVNEQTAAEVANNFIASKISGVKKENIKLLHAYSFEHPGAAEFKTYYVFDVNNKNGFIVIAADDIVKPILAYSITNQFLIGKQESPETDYWMGLYRDQIDFAIQHNLEAPEEVTAAWEQYKTANGGTANKPTNVVSPMVNTSWDQGTYYDIYTPGSGSTKTPVGCVATAMAQIMKYWNYPSSGTGVYSYNSQNYGMLSADFDTALYNWSIMPEKLSSLSLTSSKEAVSLLGYHCAIAVRMDFAPTGSGSQVLAWSNNSKSAENAFKNNFGYKSTIEGLYRDDYTDDQWLTLLKNELNAARPLLYAGFGNLGGHAFVFDGYDENDMFHINWGWGGISNGYFTVNDLAPSALGIGGGGGNFNDGQQALLNIEPSSTSDPLLALSLTTGGSLSISQGTILKGAGFSVTGAIKNNSELDYIGGYFQAEIYQSADSNFVTYFNRQQNQNILIDSTQPVSFMTNGIGSLNEGDYFIKISYTDLNGNWRLLGDHDGFVNHVDLKIEQSPTGIENFGLDKLFTVFPNPANTTIYVDFKNFTGKVNTIQLFNLQGQKMSIGESIAPVTSSLQVNQLADGMYYLNIITDQGIATKKLVIQH